jgi:hypothetical protein
VVFERHIIPVTLRTRHNSAKLVQLLIARYAFELLLGQEGVFLVLLILGNDQDDFLDFGLKEEQGFFDLEFVALEVDHVVDLRDLFVHLLSVLVVLRLSHPSLQFGLDFLQTGKYLSLQIFKLFLQLGHVVLFDNRGELVDVPHLLLESAFVEAHPILEGIQLGPQFDHFRFDFVDLVLDALSVVLFVDFCAFVSARAVEHFEILVDFLQLHLEIFYLLGPFLDYALNVAADQTFTRHAAEVD